MAGRAVRFRRRTPEEIYLFWRAERDVMEPVKDWLNSFGARYELLEVRLLTLEFLEESYGEDRRFYEKLVRKTHRGWLRADRAG